jgi:hypothetical protein
LVGAEGFSRPVAIKRVLPSYSDDTRFAEMFVKEANLTARLSHQNLVSVLDFDRDPVHGYYLVMELVKGCDLARLMATGALPVPVAIHLTCEILAGLGYAHHLPLNDLGISGMIHRDVSPHNVLLSWDGAVKVSDFGIAKAHGLAAASASVEVKGKLAYMSPEQANGQSLDGRSDLFAVGVMLWEMLTGQTLFLRSSPQESLSALLVQPIPSPREVRREVPADVAAVTMRLLQRDVSARSENANRAMEELRACRESPADGRSRLVALLHKQVAEAPRHPAAPTLAVAPAEVRPGARGATARVSVPARAAARSSTRSMVRALGIAATLAALGAGGGWWWSRHGAAAPTASTADSRGSKAGGELDNARTIPLAPAPIAPQPATVDTAAMGDAGAAAPDASSPAAQVGANGAAPAPSESATKAAPKTVRREASPSSRSGILQVRVGEPAPAGTP